MCRGVQAPHAQERHSRALARHKPGSLHKVDRREDDLCPRGTGSVQDSPPVVRLLASRLHIRSRAWAEARALCLGEPFKLKGTVLPSCNHRPIS